MSESPALPNLGETIEYLRRQGYGIGGVGGQVEVHPDLGYVRAPGVCSAGVGNPERHGGRIDSSIPHDLLAHRDHLRGLGVIDQAATGKAAGHRTDEVSN